MGITFEWDLKKKKNLEWQKVWMEALQMTIMRKICLTVKKYLDGPKHKQ